MNYRLLPVLLPLAVIWSCAGENSFRRASGTITAEELRDYTMTLAADSFMGRQPFTHGETVTVNYLASGLEKIGFDPLFDESWFQEVPMTEITTRVTNPVIITSGNDRLDLSAPDEIAIESPAPREDIIMNSIPMVFCGFGIIAPEYGWNDYEKIDVRGKCAVVLINDPGLYTGDGALFKGRTMTYYGRWTYKYEEAARQGAAMVLIVHEPVGAGYDYSIPRTSSMTSSLYLREKEGSQIFSNITGWLNGEAAEKLFALTGHDIAELRKESCVRGYRGFDMGTAITIEVHNAIEHNVSANVGGILRGTSNPEEAVVITAHWDHFGIGEAINGDSIYNGAVDNGTTMAWAFEIGEAFSYLRKRPDRSVIILFPTAEEQGLLGSYYFMAHPPLPPENMTACFNNDMMLAMGRMKDIMVTGYGQSDLEDMLAVAVAKQDRYILPDPTPETGMYFRSDHFPFARAGVPSLFARGNCDSREHGKEWAAEMEKDYLTHKYHKPADNYYPTMDFEGIAEDARATFEVAWQIACNGHKPSWKSQSEFGSLRP